MLLIPSLAFIAGLLYVPAVAADETGRAFGISNGKAAGAFHQPALVVPSKKMATFEFDDASKRPMTDSSLALMPRAIGDRQSAIGNHNLRSKIERPSCIVM